MGVIELRPQSRSSVQSSGGGGGGGGGGAGGPPLSELTCQLY